MLILLYTYYKYTVKRCIAGRQKCRGITLIAMIKGIGIDIVEIGRIEKNDPQLRKPVLGKVFTEAEIVYCQKMAKPAIHFAGRWAAKEAFYKALPQECQRVSGWKSMEVIAAGPQAPSISVRRCSAGKGNEKKRR